MGRCSESLSRSALTLHLPVAVMCATAQSNLRIAHHTGPVQIHGAICHEENSCGHRRDQRSTGRAMVASGAWGRSRTPHTLLRRLRAYSRCIVNVGDHRISFGHSRHPCDLLLAQGPCKALTTSIHQEAARVSRHGAMHKPRAKSSPESVDDDGLRPVASRRRSPLTYFALTIALSIPFWVAGAMTEFQLLPGIPSVRLGSCAWWGRPQFSSTARMVLWVWRRC